MKKLRTLLYVDPPLMQIIDREAKNTQRTRCEVVRSLLRRAITECALCGAPKKSGEWCSACFRCSACGGNVCGGKGCMVA